MFSSYNELILKTWMLKIMDDICNKRTKQINFLNLCLEISNCHKIVHSLHRVNNVLLIMILIFLEISGSYLLRKLIASFHANKVFFIKIVFLEYLMNKVRKALITYHFATIKNIKLNFFKIFHERFNLFLRKVSLINSSNIKKLKIYILFVVLQLLIRHIRICLSFISCSVLSFLLNFL